MSTTPPPEEPQRPATSYPWSNMPDVARLPIPGNAELLVWLLALIVAMLVVWIADSLSTPTWFDFFKWTTIAYILSRGVAKASRVLEQ
jgi:hypothetical protein